MSDIGLFIIDGCFDIDILNDDLRPDDGLETSVAISVFTDRRITDDNLPILETDKRGWWGDMFPEIPNDQIGSRLWLIEREKNTTETLRRSEEFIEKSLQWMIEDGVSNGITAVSFYDNNKQLISDVDISRPDQESERFQVLWDAQELRRA